MIDPNIELNKECELDVEWFERFEKIGSFEAYEFLAGDKESRAIQQKKFFDGEIRNPVLDYPELNEKDLLEKRAGLRDLKSDIESDETSPILRQVYLWKINVKLAELGMMLSLVKNLRRREVGETEAVRWQGFNRANDFVNGRPDLALFHHAVSILAQDASLDEDEGEELKKAATSLKKVLPVLNDGEELARYEQSITGLTLPNESLAEDLMEGIRAELIDLLGEGYLEELQERTENSKFDAQEMKKVFEIVLERLGVDETWEVVVTDKRSSVGVSHERKLVMVPSDRSVNLQDMLGLVVHEMGTHIDRRVSGKNSKLQLLSLGLDRYVSGEEGIATAKEQILEGDVKDFSGLDGHLAISLAKGLDGEPRDFRAVFEILNNYYYLLALKDGVSEEKAEKDSSIQAYKRCVRTFRGTFCDVPGVCFSKDIAYREGNAALWNYLEINGKDSFKEFRLGKYDPSNPRHMWILNMLGILDIDSDKLDSIYSDIREEATYHPRGHEFLENLA